MRAFERFPTWMWRNAEFDGFIRWLHGHNADRPYERMCGFYGLDLYNLAGSMEAVIDFLQREDPELARLAHLRYGCLEPWAEEPQLYGRNALLEGYARCEVGVVQMLKDLLQKQVDCFAEECDEWLDARANARLVKNAEAYYRVMYHGSAESWNLRDTHMFETLNMILDAKGPQSKRSTGVTHPPETERWSHYSQATCRGESVACVGLAEAGGVQPLPAELGAGEVPRVGEPYPSAVWAGPLRPP